MTTAWNNQDEMYYFNREDGEASFQRHDESMRKFRLAHPRVEVTTSTDAEEVDWLTLLPVKRVKLDSYVRN